MLKVIILINVLQKKCIYQNQKKINVIFKNLIKHFKQKHRLWIKNLN